MTAPIPIIFGAWKPDQATFQSDALTDALTSLPNRRAFIEALERALDGDVEPRILALFDLDGFKRYNDAYGHPAGDALLTRLSGALGDVVHGHGRAFRLGGDEFCLLLKGRVTTDDALIGAATAALTERGSMFSVTAAHGLATVPDEAATTTAVLQLADQRMYAAKARTSRSTPPRTHDVLMQILSERTPGLLHANGQYGERELLEGVTRLLPLPEDRRCGDELFGRVEQRVHVGSGIAVLVGDHCSHIRS